MEMTTSKLLQTLTITISHSMNLTYGSRDTSTEIKGLVIVPVLLFTCHPHQSFKFLQTTSSDIKICLQSMSNFL